MSVFIGENDFFGPALPTAPCSAYPGSPAKVSAMAARFERFEDLFCENDPRYKQPAGATWEGKAQRNNPQITQFLSVILGGRDRENDGPTLTPVNGAVS